MLGEGGGDQSVTVEGVVRRGVEGGIGPVLEGGLGAEGAAQRGAQAHGVGALVDEAGPVGGILDGVGEDEGALVGVVEGVVAEEGGQADGKEGGDGGAEESDGVRGPAGGADVVGRVLGDGALVAGEDEDGQVAALAGLQRALLGDAGEQLAVGNGVPTKPGVVAGRIRLTGLDPATDVGLLTGGGEQRAKAGVAEEAVAAYLALVDLLPLTSGGEADTPTGAAAGAAVEGGSGGDILG